MKYNNSFLCLALVLAAALPSSARAADEENAAVIGQPVSLVVQPATIRLSGPRAMQQIIVTGRYEDGAERDLTPFCTLKAEADDVVAIHPGGCLQARKDGRAMLVVQAGPRTLRVPIVVEDTGKPQPVSFRHEFHRGAKRRRLQRGGLPRHPQRPGRFQAELARLRPGRRLPRTDRATRSAAARTGSMPMPA